MSSIYEKIDNRIETFLSTLKRFPLASSSALLITMIFLVLIDHHTYNSPNVIIALKVAFVSTLGVVLFPALQLLSRFTIVWLMGILILGVYYYCLPHNIDDANETIFIRHILLWIALFSMIIWAPFLFRKSNNDTFWQYAQSIIFGFIVSIFFSIIVYGGLAAALYAIEKLFHFDIMSVRYGQLAIIVFGVFGVNFFLSQIPKHPLFMHIRPYSKIKKIFSKNILAPIAIVYFIILFTYTAKILISMTWPSGTLSWIIVAFSFVAIVSFLFLSPYLKKSSVTQRLIWLAIFLQTIMLGMALWIRIEDYGITYNRYLLAGFGLWLALMSLYFILFGKAQQKWLFIFASFFILFSQFGPYSAKNISQKSQTARLVKLISTADLHSDKLDIKRKYEISDGISYIQKNYGVNAFEKIIPHILKKFKALDKTSNSQQQYNFPYFATKELGFKYINYWEWRNFQENGEKQELVYYIKGYPKVDILNVKEYDWVLNFSLYRDKEKTHLLDKETNLTIQFKEQTFFIEDNNETNIKVDLQNFIQNLVTTHKNGAGLSSEEMTFIQNDSQIQFKMEFTELTLNKEAKIQDFRLMLLLKIKKLKPQPFISPYLKPTPMIRRNLNKK